MRIFRTELAFAALFSVSLLDAQNCTGEQDFAGPFGFVASRVAFAPVAFTPPGTTGESLLAPVQRLIRRTNVPGSFSVSGRLLADGAGGLLAATASGLAPVGSYRVMPECGLTISFDVGTSDTGAPRPALKFQGVLWDRGDSAVLMQSEGGSPPAQLQLSRPFLSNGCSASSLSGLFGLAASGVEARDATIPGGRALQFIGYFFADGAGQLISRAGTGDRLTGTYSIREDCTGTARLKMATGETTYSMSLVLLEKSGSVFSALRPAVAMTFDELNVAGVATAR